MNNQSFDVIIAGGGLAGLGLAFQIKKGSPELNICVIEKRQFPLPRAIAKVGESTVEIGSRYLAKHLELSSHLTDEHLKKFGIRMFFGEPCKDLSQQDELGASQVFGIPTYQIDRGDIENHLAEKIRGMGVTFLDNCAINRVEMKARDHKITVEKNGEHTLQSTWLLDASGRHSLIKREQNLSKNNKHNANAVWFRIDKKIEIDDWSQNNNWHKRCAPTGRRWLSTNHLVGPGYWVWIIPLASGVTSIGIVMDDHAFQESNISDKNSAIAWLTKNQTRLAAEIRDASFLDFVAIEDYSYDCKRLFSDDGWAITGEAGLFADPFYSPGSDFIAISNNFIADLVQSDLRGEDIRFKRALYERLHFSIYNNTLSLYQNQYGGFGDRVMMGLKLLWDYSYYWGVLSLLFFRDALTDIPLMRDINPILHKAQTLNQDVQAHFRTRAERRAVLPNRGMFMDQFKIPCLQEFNQVLMDDAGDTKADLLSNVAKLEVIADSTIDMLQDTASMEISEKEMALLGEYRKAIIAT